MPAPPRPALSVEILGDASRSVQPGATLTLFVRITQASPGQSKAVPSLELPPGWFALTPLDTLTLAGTAPAAQLVSVRVPAQEEPGVRRLRFTVMHGADQAFADIDVQVEPRYAIETTVRTVPAFVQAGEAFELEFDVRNGSNTRAAVLLSSRNGDVPASKVELDVAEEQSIRVRAEAPEDVRRRRTIKVVLDAQIDGQQVHGKAEASVIVIPTRTSSQRQRTYPAFWSASLTGSSLGSMQPQIQAYGEGPIDEAGDRRFGFELRVPEVNQQTLYDEWDRYWAYYEKPGFYLSAGDGAYGLTPLTDPDRSGFGVETRIRRNGWLVGGFARRSRRSVVQERAGGFSVGYGISDELGTYGEVSAQVGARTGFDEAQTFSLRSRIGRGRRAALDAEIAGGLGGFGQSQAYRVEVSGRERKLAYSAAYRSVDGQYPGYQRGTSILRADVTYRPASWLQASVSAGQSEQRPLVDRTGRAQDYGRSYLQARVRPLGLDVRGRLGVETRSLEIEQLNRRESGVLGEVRLGVPVLRIDGRLQTGVATGIDESEGRYLRYRVGLGSTLGPFSLGAAYQDRTGRTIYLAAREQLSVTSLFASLNIRQWTRFSLNVTSSQDRSLTDARYTYATASLEQRVWRGHRLRLASTRIDASSFGGTVHAFRFSYRVPFELPVIVNVARRTIRGRFHDVQTNAPVRNALVYIGDDVRVTGNDGSFEFKATGEGPYYVVIDRKSIGFDRITDQPMPLEVQFEPGQKTVELSIGVSQAAQITGRVVLYQHESAIAQMRGADPVPAGGLRALIEINNADFVQRQYSDPDGRFTFNELPPGTYTLTVRSYRAPANHAYTDPPTIITVSPGQTSEAELRILPTTRQIRMLDSGG
ncbi:MAG: hypothetical protein AAGI08_05820 [Bacteroidota bacterium]